MKYQVVVTAESREDGRVNVGISYPQNQSKISFQATAHILASGISLLVRMCDQESGIKDHELIRDVINQLEQEFISTTDFNDAKLHHKSNGKVSI
jgi:hypothetical protein